MAKKATKKRLTLAQQLARAVRHNQELARDVRYYERRWTECRADVAHESAVHARTARRLDDTERRYNIAVLTINELRSQLDVMGARIIDQLTRNVQRGGYATEIGQLAEGDRAEHQNGDGARQATEAGGGDRTQQGREIE